MSKKGSKIKVADQSKKFIEWLDSLRQNRNVVMFLIFLVISTGFWFLNALRKDYTATLSYPVKLVNVPSNKMLPTDFDNEIRVKVRTGGFVILRYRLSKTFLPLTFDVSQMKAWEGGDFDGVFVPIKDVRNRIVGQLSQGMQLIEVEPDTLFVPFITRSTRKVPVEFRGTLTFQQQYTQSGPLIITPDSVEISGLQTLVDSVSVIPTNRLELKQLADTFSTTVAITLPEGVSVSPRKVSVVVPVEPFTELNLKIPVQVKGLPDSLRIKIFPSEIQVSFHVGVSNFAKINRSLFRAVVDVSPVFSGDPPSRLKVNLDQMPAEVKSVRFSPIFVEYLLEKKR